MLLRHIRENAAALGEGRDAALETLDVLQGAAEDLHAKLILIASMHGVSSFTRPTVNATAATAKAYLRGVATLNRFLARFVQLPQNSVGSTEDFITRFPEYTQCESISAQCLHALFPCVWRSSFRRVRLAISQSTTMRCACT